MNIKNEKMGSYKVLNDKVIQGAYQAKAVSSKEVVSDYESLGKRPVSPVIKFKFALNGHDNEMEIGKDHEFACISQNGICETPLIIFGQQLEEDEQQYQDQYLNSETELLVKLDLRLVLAAFERQGYFETYNGQKVYEGDFSGVYIAGGIEPLTWDFAALKNRDDLKLNDDDGDGIYECKIILNPRKASIGTKSWKLVKDISSYPSYTSEQLLVDALYNMSLEELILNKEDDGTFRTGKEWGGVWTRDISYSAILSLAMLDPEICKTSLRQKIKGGKIVQDTGTGGAYPVSTDRVVWVIAAWEVYLITGERAWLEEIYPVIKTSLEDDMYNAFNYQTGLVKGESSFLDWREQTYPEWMEPADIYESEDLGTNAVHYKAHSLMSEMADIFDESETSKKHKEIALSIKNSINHHLWLEDKGYYSQYLYGRNFKIISPRAEALGAALTILWDIADEEMQKTLMSRLPVIDYGTPSIFPQIPDIPSYHNDGIWPFVQAYWSLAAAKVGNRAALTHSMDALYRAAALFLSNKENFVAHSGDYGGTQVNSDRQLWSVAGNLSMVYKVFFGMVYEVDQLIFKPVVPQKYAGSKKLSGFKYRDAILDLELNGWGSRVKEVKLNGEVIDQAALNADLAGHQSMIITLEPEDKIEQSFNLVKNNFSPKTPKVNNLYGKLSWESDQNISEYIILRNGVKYKTIQKTSIELNSEGYGEYQVVAVDNSGVSSFASEPIVHTNQQIYNIDLAQFITSPAIEYRGYFGMGYIPINTHENTRVTLTIEVKETGLFSIKFRYSNGHGPVNTNNKCALRSLYLDEKFVGTVVLPQRGDDSWSDWGFSNAVQVNLNSGQNLLVLSLEDHNTNMDITINEAMLDSMEVVKLE